MSFLERGTATLYYEVQGTGPAIVLVHGVGGNHAAWFQQVPVFARSYQVITFGTQSVPIQRLKLRTGIRKGKVPTRKRTVP